MTLLNLFQSMKTQERIMLLNAAINAHESACADVEDRRKAGDTRGLHEALERARLALHERMRLEAKDA